MMLHVVWDYMHGALNGAIKREDNSLQQIQALPADNYIQPHATYLE